MYSFGYSPFTDNEGTSKNIYEITYDDLNQLKLKGIEEGRQIEYKSEYPDSVKAKMPKIITSFANERGGWIFVGIYEDTKFINPIDKSKHEESLNNLLRDHTSPIPRIEVRFLTKTPTDTKGVLVVWVPEGDKPPYIADGVVCVRRGSNKLSLKSSEDRFSTIEDRYHLDKLYQKSNDNIARLKEFCKKEISIYNREWSYASKDYINYGMCNIYLIPLYKINLLYKKNMNEISNFFIDESGKQQEYFYDGKLALGQGIKFFKSNASLYSQIYRSTESLDTFESTVAWEQFYDGSAKFHIPIKYYNKEAVIPTLKQYVMNYIDEKIFNKFDYADGRLLFFSAFGSIGLYINSMKKLDNNFNDLMIIIELENIRKDVLYFDTDRYKEFLKEKGYVFSDKNYYITNSNFYTDKIKEKDLLWFLEVLSPISFAFGYNIVDITNLILDPSANIV